MRHAVVCRGRAPMVRDDLMLARLSHSSCMGAVQMPRGDEEIWMGLRRWIARSRTGIARLWDHLGSGPSGVKDGSLGAGTVAMGWYMKLSPRGLVYIITILGNQFHLEITSCAVSKQHYVICDQGGFGTTLSTCEPPIPNLLVRGYRRDLGALSTTYRR